MGYLNPLLDLPTGQALRRLEPGARRRLEGCLRALRAQANDIAESAWTGRARVNPTLLNPLFDLPAGVAMLDLPATHRFPLQMLCQKVRTAALAEAAEAWRRRKAPMALYYRMLSTYAGLTGRMLREGAGSAKKALARHSVHRSDALAVFFRALSTYARHAAHAASIESNASPIARSTTHRRRRPTTGARSATQASSQRSTASS